MAIARFDILFSGKLMEDADPDAARSQIKQRFKLSEAAMERLFCGHTVTLKRNVDTATASRYREVFRDAKALIEIRPVDTPFETLQVPASPSLDTGDVWPEAPASVESGGLLPDTESQRNEHREQAHADGAEETDIDRLTLVAGHDWTLEDCQPPLPPVMLPDTSHLELVEPEPDVDTEQEA